MRTATATPKTAVSNQDCACEPTKASRPTIQSVTPATVDTATATAAPPSTQRKRSRLPEAAKNVSRMAQISVPSIPSRAKMR